MEYGIVGEGGGDFFLTGKRGGLEHRRRKFRFRETLEDKSPRAAISLDPSTGRISECLVLVLSRNVPCGKKFYFPRVL